MIWIVVGIWGAVTLIQGFHLRMINGHLKAIDRHLETLDGEAGLNAVDMKDVK